MCTVGYNNLSCGCRTPDVATFQRCEDAQRKGHACPESKITEDTSRSRTYDLRACMVHMWADQNIGLSSWRMKGFVKRGSTVGRVGARGWFQGEK